MKASETIVELATALAKAQGQIEDATKDGINPAFRSKYADLAAVRAVIREPLAANDLAIMQFPRTRQGYAEVETMLVHKSGEFVSETLEIPVSKFDAHGIGSGITYGRRYGLMSILCLAAVDDDGNAAVEKAPAQQSAKKPSPKPERMEISKEETDEVSDTLLDAAYQGTEYLTKTWRSLEQIQRNAIPAEAIARFKLIAADADSKQKGAK
jgi:hypothetical protein